MAKEREMTEFTYIFFPQGKIYISLYGKKQVAKNIYITPWVEFMSVKIKQGKNKIL